MSVAQVNILQSNSQLLLQPWGDERTSRNEPSGQHQLPGKVLLLGGSKGVLLHFRELGKQRKKQTRSRKGQAGKALQQAGWLGASSSFADGQQGLPWPFELCFRLLLPKDPSQLRSTRLCILAALVAGS